LSRENFAKSAKSAASQEQCIKQGFEIGDRVAISSFIIYFLVANVWRNVTSQFLFSLAKVAKATAIVANNGGVTNVGKSRKTGGEQ
jgi:hypothetical protein